MGRSEPVSPQTRWGPLPVGSASHIETKFLVQEFDSLFFVKILEPGDLVCNREDDLDIQTGVFNF
jgi:hypothetical protein